MGYTINGNLQIGDIILIMSGTKFGKIISSVTKGDFSHVGLVFKERKYIEALTSGVQATSTLQIQVKDKEKIKILRPTAFKNNKLKEACIVKILEEANPNRYRKYNYKGAVTSVLKKEFIKTNKTFFCSELVALIYQKIGLSLFEKEPEKVNPNDFVKLIGNLLEDVSDEIITQLPSYSKLYQMDIKYLDVNKKTEFHESKLISEFIAEVEKILVEHEMGMNKMGVIELINIYSLEDKVLMKTLDTKFANEYKKLKINEHVKDSFSKVKGKDFKKFEEDLTEFTFEDISHFLYVQNSNKEHENQIKTKYIEYISIINSVKDSSYHEYADLLLNYFKIYLDHIERGLIQWEKEEKIINLRLNILKPI